ncbi:hypothetical protein CSOJ01_11277 [Colletotrichum sojae]|uniref:C2H2-type domain-containing protein n=1 Tax=Colletotrichum sojae TaxID=2175907 RepID=A0A8H6IYN2_9PEZI|nr:hypothetical protein CSOJ01_11277 [Colletotrichum sojae]
MRLVNRSSQPLPPETRRSCPFCLEDLASLKQYRHHVGRHQQDLALFALPNAAFTDENSEEDDDALGDNGHDSNSLASGDRSIPRSATAKEVASPLELEKGQGPFWADIGTFAHEKGIEVSANDVINGQLVDLYYHLNLLEYEKHARERGIPSNAAQQRDSPSTLPPSEITDSLDSDSPNAVTVFIAEDQTQPPAAPFSPEPGTKQRWQYMNVPFALPDDATVAETREIINKPIGEGNYFSKSSEFALRLMQDEKAAIVEALAKAQRESRLEGEQSASRT